MKTKTWLGFLAVAVVSILAARGQTTAEPTAAGEVNLAPPVAEVIHLAEANTSEDVIIAYVQNSPASFNLSADQILYLRDIGITSPVITAMLSRDAALKNQPQTYSYNQSLYPPSTSASNPPPVAPEPAAAAPTPTAEAPADAPPATVPATAPAAAPVYVTSPPQEVNYFYNDLAPYGTWIQLDGVGWCWQPRAVVVNTGWRPYCDSGHWVNTEAGWYWVSDYSWGWAPFHYGRWHHHTRCGWVWLPDREWGPAWVVWRSGGDYCGWAPLPPHARFEAGFGWRFNGVHVAADFDFGVGINSFIFIGFGDFNRHDYRHHRLPPDRVASVYHHTTVINHYDVHNHTVINRGVPPERVAAVTHAPVRQVPIRDVRGGGGVRGPRPAGVGRNETVVYRPELHAPTQPVHAVAQRVDDKHPVVQHAPLTPTVNRNPNPAGRLAPAGTGPAPQRQVSPAAQRQASPAATPWLNSDRSAPANQRPAATQQRPAATQPSSWRAATPSTPEPARTETPKTAAVGGYANNGNPSRELYPLRTASPNQPDLRPAGAQNQPVPQYYPKSAHQAAEARSVPTVSPRSSPAAAPTPTPAPAPFAPANNAGHGQGQNQGQGKKFQR